MAGRYSRGLPRRGHEAIVQRLLNTGKIDIDSKDNYGRTPFSGAAWRGHQAIVQLLLNAEKIEIDSKDKYGRTPLWWAASNGHEGVVALLKSYGARSIKSSEVLLLPPRFHERRGHSSPISLGRSR